jgi:GT2 family glycosyltransferase
MPSEPLVTIILVNWNGREVTLDCLASLHDIAFPNRSILVVDNASTDGSPDAFRSAFPGVEVLALKENRRFAGGMNAGIRHALAGGAELLLLMIRWWTGIFWDPWSTVSGLTPQPAWWSRKSTTMIRRT